MLVLSRKVDEQIIIGDSIRVTVVSIRGNQVRLGFEAPPSVPIFREELQSKAHQHPLLSGEIPGEIAQTRCGCVLTASGEH
ncbi:MAG: carbon storage regulator CsrA [Isosphaeraceae bacterium]